MVKLTKAQERISFLRRWSDGGWNDFGQSHGKKWIEHKSILVRTGHLEPDGYGLYRITPAGRRALEEE